MRALQKCEYCKASGQAFLPHPDLPADFHQLYHRANLTVPEQRDDFTFRYACKDCGTIYLSRKEINDHIEATHPLPPIRCVSMGFPPRHTLPPSDPNWRPEPAYPVHHYDVDDVMDYMH